MKTRAEEIAKAARQYGDSPFMMQLFTIGAVWADNHPHKDERETEVATPSEDLDKTLESTLDQINEMESYRDALKEEIAKLESARAELKKSSKRTATKKANKVSE